MFDVRDHLHMSSYRFDPSETTYLPHHTTSSLESQTINPSLKFRNFQKKNRLYNACFQLKIKMLPYPSSTKKEFPLLLVPDIIIRMTRYVLLDYQIGSQTWVGIYWRSLATALVAFIIFYSCLFGGEGHIAILNKYPTKLSLSHLTQIHPIKFLS